MSGTLSAMPVDSLRQPPLRADGVSVGFADAILSGAQAMLRTASVATLLLDARGRVVATNRAADGILSNETLFVDRSHRLRARVAAVDASIAQVVGEVVPPSRTAAALRVRDFGAGGDILLSFAPLSYEADALHQWLSLLDGDAPAAVVHLANDGAPAVILAPMLQQLYALGDEEAQLALSLYAGMGLAHFAAAEGVSLYHATLLLERLTERMGAHRTADIVRKVAALAAIAVPSQRSA